MLTSYANRMTKTLEKRKLAAIVSTSATLADPHALAVAGGFQEAVRAVAHSFWPGAGEGCGVSHWAGGGAGSGAQVLAGGVEDCGVSHWAGGGEGGGARGGGEIFGQPEPGGGGTCGGGLTSSTIDSQPPEGSSQPI